MVNPYRVFAVSLPFAAMTTSYTAGLVLALLAEVWLTRN